MPKITQIFAFITDDSGPGDEGVIGMEVNGMMMPLVCADQERVDSLRPIAQGLAAQMNKTVRLVVFKSMEVVETYNDRRHLS